MLVALRYDGVLSATELASVANIAPSTASEHLAKLMAAGLVFQQKLGRKRLYTLADGDVCDLIDGVAAHADKNGSVQKSKASLPYAVLHSRLCLDHLGGELGCLISNTMFSNGIIRHTPNGPRTSLQGEKWLMDLGVGNCHPSEHLRCPLRLCHDWSQGGFHLGGSIAGEMLRIFRERDWLRFRRGEIAVAVTPKGVTGLRNALGLDLRNTSS